MDMDSSSVDNQRIASESVTTNGVSSSSECRLHRAAFHGDLSEVKELLESGVVEVSAPDKHGEIAIASVIGNDQRYFYSVYYIASY